MAFSFRFCGIPFYVFDECYSVHHSAHIEVNMTLYYCISQLDLEKKVRIEFLPGGNSHRMLVALPRRCKVASPSLSYKSFLGNLTCIQLTGE